MKIKYNTYLELFCYGVFITTGLFFSFSSYLVHDNLELFIKALGFGMVSLLLAILFKLEINKNK